MIGVSGLDITGVAKESLLMQVLSLAMAFWDAAADRLDGFGFHWDGQSGLRLACMVKYEF
jgi:hypothetical protein